MVQNWHHLVSFVGTFGEYQRDGIRADKTDFMVMIAKHIPAEQYIMVGNILGVSGASDDKGSAERAGWRFISETEFANGVR